MGFTDWAKEKDFWKTETTLAFQVMYHTLINAGHTQEEAFDLMDRILAAVSTEYGD